MHQVDQIAPLQRRQLGAAQALVGHDAVVLERAAEMQVVGEMPPALRQVAAHHGMRDDRAALLLGRERAHQRQARALLVLEQVDALERPVIGVVRLRAPERRRQHHLLAEHEAVQHQMVAEQLPAPRLARGRLAEQAEDEAPLAHHLRPADQIAEEAVEPHHVARQLVALRAHAGAQHRHHGLAQRLADLVEPQPVVLEIKLGVLPAPPLVASRPESTRPCFCSADMAREQRVDRLDHGERRRALRPRREEVRDGTGRRW